jgi:hypothetical protein
VVVLEVMATVTMEEAMVEEIADTKKKKKKPRESLCNRFSIHIQVATLLSIYI